MYSDKSINTPAPQREMGDYIKMSRTIVKNHLLTELTKSGTGKKPALHQFSDFFSRVFWKWIYYYLQSRFGPNYPYPRYQAPETGVYKLNDHPENTAQTIAICSDWATDTAESVAIAKQMGTHDPDFTIHVGDTYYVGSPEETRSNFTDSTSAWVRGKRGSFALLGNHEMYARGVAFFKYLLKTLGLRDSNGLFEGQKAGYFCLENDHWRILGLDTGYHSIGIPLLEFLPWFAPKCRFDRSLVNWLRQTVKLGDPNDKRGLLILTHHQYISAFKESEYGVPATQLAEIIGKERKVVWIWGHEHKFSMYEKAQFNDGVTAYGRCIGHGGTPVELNSGTFKMNTGNAGYPKLVMKDDRGRATIADTPLGYNGYALVTLKDQELTIEYYDVNGPLLSETWKSNHTGDISGIINIPAGCKLKPEINKNWDDATKA